MLKAHWKKHTLVFRQASGTSRGILRKKESWFIFIYDDLNPNIIGIGECGLLKGLSVDPYETYEDKLNELCNSIHQYEQIDLSQYPSIRIGLEIALLDFKNDGKREIFSTDFFNKNKAIPINGLIWMGDKSFMFQQIKDKIAAGFDCVKLKIGAINFSDELELLKYIRDQFSVSDIELRVDANGAFSPKNAIEKLNWLSAFDLHSIEQPIRQGQWQEMAKLCAETPLDIALDEELIGVEKNEKRKELLNTIEPQYIILKPSLVGGFKDADEWISLAKERNINYWATSALESNIGLNAISQWCDTLNSPMHQGLGTGQLYTNNIPSPLVLEKGSIYYKKGLDWDLSLLGN